MKILAFIITAFLFSIPCHAQDVNGADSTVQNFKKYLSKNIRYLAVARENNVQGTAILTMKINADKKIDSIMFGRHIMAELDSEIIKKVRLYSKIINLSKGEYAIGFEFIIQDDNNYKIKPIDSSHYSNYLFDIDIVAYATVRKTSIVY